MASSAAKNPELNASILNRLFLVFIFPLLRLGASRPLQPADLGAPMPCDEATGLTSTFGRHWATEMGRPVGKRSISRALRRTIGWEWLVAIAAFFVSAGLNFLPPLILQQLVAFLQGSQPLSTSSAWIDVVALFVVPVLSSLLANYHNNVMARVGTNMRTALTGAIYDKAMRLRPTGAFTTGEVVNRMSVDAALPLRFVAFASQVFVAPPTIGVAVWLIYRYVGVSAFSGLAFMMVSLPLSGFLMKSLFKLRFAALRKADLRVKLINEALAGIRMLKFYAWEVPFARLISDVRDEELALIERAAYSMQVNMSLLMMSLPVLLPVIIFAVFAALGNTLQPSVIFATISLLALIQQPLAFLPLGLVMWLQFNISLGRISALLQAPDLEPVPLIADAVVAAATPIRISGASFRWDAQPPQKSGSGAPRGGGPGGGDRGSSSRKVALTPAAAAAAAAEAAIAESQRPPTLVSVSLDVRAGELLAVVGPVAAGKSSLLSAMMGDIPGLSGTVERAGPVGYAGQQPWVLNATLRENVLFGAPMDAARYAAVLDACALGPDIALLRNGDETEIGEKGVTLSGGQKARLCVARVCYAAPSLCAVLLDDPLAAVDAHVGAQLFSAAIAGPIMAGVTRVLVTNALYVLPQCDRVVVMGSGGIVRALGTLEEIRSAHPGLIESLAVDVGGSSSGGEQQVPLAAAPSPASAAAAAASSPPAASAPIAPASPVEDAGACEPDSLSLSPPAAAAVDAITLDSLGPPTAVAVGAITHDSLSLPTATPVESAADPMAAPADAAATCAAPAGAAPADAAPADAAPADAAVDTAITLKSVAVALVPNTDAAPTGAAPTGAAPADAAPADAAPADAAPADATVDTAITLESVAVALVPNADVAADPADAAPADAAPEDAAVDTAITLESVAVALVQNADVVAADPADAAPADAAPEDASPAPARPVVAVSSVMTEEERATGRVQSGVVFTYFAANGAVVVTMMLMLSVASQACSVAGSFWISAWASAAITAAFSGGIINTNYWLGGYVALGLASVVASAVRGAFLARGRVNASRALHAALLSRILAAPVFWFDSTPLGRVLNRFSRDIYTIDNELPMSVNQLVNGGFMVLGTLITIAVSTKGILLVALLPIVVAYVWLQSYFRLTSTELQRLESVSRSPIFSQFSLVLSGTSVIRAFGVERRYTTAAASNVNANTVPYLLTQLAGNWLGLYLSIMSALVGFIVAVVAIGWPGVLSATWVALALSSSLQLGAALTQLMRMAAQFEAQMNSVERVSQYATTTPQEAGADAAALVRRGRSARRLALQPAVTPASLPWAWPAQGRVEFRGLRLRYGRLPEGEAAGDTAAAASVPAGVDGTSDLELGAAGGAGSNRNTFSLGIEVLHGVSFTVPPGQKLGIVGRTGSGKSSLAAALFRIVEPSGGAVLLDGVDTASVPLPLLRSRVSIIPQEPTLFSTTIRANLDPFGLHKDEELAAALSRVRLAHLSLDAPVAEGGASLSVGERQLLCIARALLRHSSVIVFDEATASIDSATDAFVQAAIRELFAEATVLTIAHRLATVADADAVLVMDAGVVAEMGRPLDLLAGGPGSTGAFKALVDRLGHEAAGDIHRLAEAAAQRQRRPQLSTA